MQVKRCVADWDRAELRWRRLQQAAFGLEHVLSHRAAGLAGGPAGYKNTRPTILL